MNGKIHTYIHTCEEMKMHHIKSKEVSVNTCAWGPDGKKLTYCSVIVINLYMMHR